VKINWPWAKKAISPADLALELFESAASKSGARVTWETAMQASTAMACSRVIAEGLAQIPLKLFRALPGGGSEPARAHPLYNVIGSAPNGWTTSFEWSFR
jgi:phage portal protein BeeE